MTGTTVVSFDDNNANPYWLGSIGPVTGLKYSDTMPGGPETMTCTVQADPTVRHDAFSPGRRVKGYRGASLVWGGTMEEPQPGDDGWSLTVSGMGTIGERWRASYASPAEWTASTVIQNAIDRNLPWQKGALASAFLSDVRDSSALNMTEFMDLITSPAGRTWRVTRTVPDAAAREWMVSLLNIPSAPTRLLIATGPVSRTLAAYINTLFVRYQKTADSGNVAATYDEVQVSNDGVFKHGVYEGFWDLSGAGVLSSGTVTSLATTALAKYTAASWAGPFKVLRGQYLTMGGSPVDLGCEVAGEVAQLIISTGPYGGEITPAPPITFPVGKVEYDNDEDSLLITPLQSWTGDLNAVLQLLAPKAPV